MSDSPEERILTVTALQILVTYSLYNKEKAISLDLYTKTLQEYRTLGDTSLLDIPPVNNKELRMIEADMPEPDVTTTQPLRLEMIVVLSKATEKFSDYKTKQAISKCVRKMSNQTKKQILPHSVGLWTLQRNINSTLKNVLNNPSVTLGITRHATGNFSAELQCHQRALEIRVKVLGEEHPDTAQSYFNLGITQHASGDFLSALQSKQRALDIRVKLFGEEHRDTAESYFSIGVTQHALGNFSSALQSKQRALDIRVKLLGEEHPDTAASYFTLGVTQHALGNLSTALQSKQRALDIRVKLFGEEHPDTAQSYFNLAKTQHALGNFSSALQSEQRALDIRVKLFGEEHPDTAQSYFNLGVTQHALGNYSSALSPNSVLLT